MNQCKFKVGDKVKRKDGDFFSNKEKVATVGHILTPPLLKGGFTVVFAETGTNLHEDAIELAVTPFTKSDLKDGMVVTYRESYSSDNLKRVVFKGALYRVSGDGFSMSHGVYLKYFSDTLEYYDNRDMDIMKVEYMGEVLWERQGESAEQKRIKELEEGIAKMQEELNKLL